jgi:hypothetical protein
MVVIDIYIPYQNSYLYSYVMFHLPYSLMLLRLIYMFYRKIHIINRCKITKYPLISNFLLLGVF